MGADSATAATPRASDDGADTGGTRWEAGRAGLPYGLLAAVLGVAVWLAVDPRTPDLAAQVYRANLFAEVGWTVWDGRWYGGHDIPGYSLVFPPLAAWLGVRTVGALAVLVSATLFERVARIAHGPAARWGAICFAAAALGDVWSGRVTFALGVSFALAAVAVLAQGGRRSAIRSEGSPPRARVAALAAGLLAALAAACSPVAGVLLALAAVTHSLVGRSWRSAIVLGVPPGIVVAALAALFPEGGWEPYPFLSFLATVAVVLGFLSALPRGQRRLRVGALLYLAACVACVAVHTPMGANVERYGVLLAGPLLVCALLDRSRGGVAAGAADAPAAAAQLGGSGRGLRAEGAFGGLRVAVGVVAVLGIAVWTAWGPVRETAAVAGNASTSAAYYVPVERFVARHGGELVRVEVPFTRGHWEAAWLAGRVSLARGWEKQLDERYDGVLLTRGLTAAAYYRWLRAQAVSYVALPDTPLDPSSAQEGRLIEGGLPYLREVLRTRHWRIYAVRDATPLARGPGVLSGMGHDWFALRARAGGRFLVRVRYTRYWTVTHGAACVGRARGGWTAVTVRGPGAVRVAASFSLGRALGLGTGVCTA